MTWLRGFRGFRVYRLTSTSSTKNTTCLVNHRAPPNKPSSKVWVDVRVVQHCSVVCAGDVESDLT